jgi:hypothetical protein
MYYFSLKNIATAIICLMMMFFVEAAKETKKLQIAINPFDSTFFLNVGEGGIITDPSAFRPAGSYSLLNGLMFPSGTMSKNQSSFTVDKHGNPLTEENSLGRFQSFDKTLVDLLPDMIPAGAFVMMSEWGLYFKEECHDKPNNLFLFGASKMGTFAVNEVFLSWALGVLGTGCNMENNSATATLYFAPDFTSLIKIKFEEEIKYD